jgi:Domain of unknown function (DUF5666)
MKRAIVLVAALLVTAALCGTADAARWNGVVVAKDAKRKAVVTVSRGSVRTVRAPNRFRRLRVGQRVAVNARRLSDGTYAAATVRGQGRVSRVRFRGVVVRRDRRAGRLILSAGKSVFAARMTGRTLSAAVPDRGLQPGDKVAVDGDVGDGSLEADEVDEVGHADLLELEGIFLYATEDGFAIAVVHRGLVQIRVPDGMIVPPFRAGNQVAVLVRVGDDGSFTFRKGRSDVRDHGKYKDEARFEAQGILAGKSPLSVSVRGEQGTLKCAIPAGLDLAFFRIGERAKLQCVSRDGDLVMTKLRTDNGWVAGDGSGELGQHGVLTSKSATAVGVRREDTTLVTCKLARALDLSLFRLGEKVKLHCRLRAGTWMFASLHGEQASIDEEGRIELYVHGTFIGRWGDGVAVRRADGSEFGCTAPAGLDLSYFAVGELVKLHCRLDGGGRTLLSVRSERYALGADGSVELYAYGSLTAKGETSLTVTASDGAAFTCSFPTGLDLSKFALGTQVKLHCRKLVGDFRLEYLKSEAASVEVKD